jgi:hypothetical protein
VSSENSDCVGLGMALNVHSIDAVGVSILQHSGIFDSETIEIESCGVTDGRQAGVT